MKKIFTLLLVLHTWFIGSYAQSHKDISVTQADSLITANTDNHDFNIIDVRTLQEFSDGHIQHAININLYSPTFGIQLDSLDKNELFLVYCHSGARSARAIDTMKVLGFNQTYNMLGGISAWISAGYETVTNIEAFDIASIRVEMYPNPATDRVTIVLDRNSYPGVILNIYSMTGALVKTEWLTQSRQEIYIGDLSRGLHMIEFRSEGQLRIQKLIIQ